MHSFTPFIEWPRRIPSFKRPTNEKSARSFSDRSFFHGRPRGMSVPKCLFFQILEGLTEVFGGMSAGMSGRKLPLWAEVSFLMSGPDGSRHSSDQHRAGKKPINKQTHKQNFHGIVPGLSRDCPGTLPAFS